MDDEIDDGQASRIAQLETRRKHLGLTPESMAAGLSWSARDVLDVERGVASDPYMQMFFDWLERLERMPPDRLKANIERAARGEKFNPP
jgi:hypothetical protein